jgi:hypothetical protein
MRYHLDQSKNQNSASPLGGETVTMVTAHISHISWLTLRMTRGMAQKKNSPTSKDLLLSLESVRI